MWSRARRRCRKSSSGAARNVSLGLGLAAGDEDRDLTLGALLVLGVRRIGRDSPLPPLRALVATDLADAHLEGRGTILEDDLIRIGPEVVVPDRILGRAAHGCHERVLAIVH